MKTVKTLGIAALAAYALAGAVFACMFCLTRYPLGYGENTSFVCAWGLLNGHGLYRPSELTSIPGYMAVYSPLYYLFLAACIKIFGITHVPGRIFSIFSALCCAFFVGAISRKRGSGAAGAIFGSAAFLCAWPVMFWMRYSRVDFPALVFELAAVYFLLAGSSKIRRPLFILFGLTAFYTKQTDVGLIGGAILGLLAETDNANRKKAAVDGFLLAVCAALLLILLQAVTDGGFFSHALGAHKVSIRSDIFIERLKTALGDPLDVSILVLGLAVVFHRPARRFMLPFVVVPMVLSLATVGKHGSNINYFLESVAAVCIGMAVFAGSCESGEGAWRKRAAIASYVIVLLCAAGSVYARYGMFTVWKRQIQTFVLPGKTPQRVGFMMKYFRPGSLVLAQQTDLPLFAGCVPVYSDPFQRAEMDRMGTYDETPLVAALNERRIDLVLASEKVTLGRPMEYIPDGAAGAIINNYSLIRARPDGFFAYVPASKLR